MIIANTSIDFSIKNGTFDNVVGNHNFFFFIFFLDKYLYFQF